MSSVNRFMRRGAIAVLPLAAGALFAASSVTPAAAAVPSALTFPIGAPAAAPDASGLFGGQNGGLFGNIACFFIAGNPLGPFGPLGPWGAMGPFHGKQQPDCASTFPLFGTGK